MRIYNLFPLLAGPLEDWERHLQRAADLGFDWIYVNPIQRRGRSGSLYSIADPLALDPFFVRDDCRRGAPEEQVRAMVASARRRGLRMMVDLVVNHAATDSPWVAARPDWFRHENGRLVHPGCDENGRRIVWEDLAQFDWSDAPGRAALEDHADRVVEWLAGLGFEGFRCDAAYQVPSAVWRRLIARARAKRSGLVFVAETLGCTPPQTAETARAGFDAVFNSSKWWDFEAAWLMEQYHLVREHSRSIGFPESHDTPRLAEEFGGNAALLRQRYLFAALFSSGVLMPMGYEFGFRRRLDVVRTRPGDWEETGTDLSDFIRRTNAVKRDHPVFNEECPTQILADTHPRVLAMWKGSLRARQEALVILNKDAGRPQPFHAASLGRWVQTGEPLRCVSPENPLEFVPEPFEYELRPGEAVVLVSPAPSAP